MTPAPCTLMPDGTCTHRAECEWTAEQLGKLPGESRCEMVLRVAGERLTREQAVMRAGRWLDANFPCASQRTEDSLASLLLGELTEGGSR